MSTNTNNNQVFLDCERLCLNTKPNQIPSRSVYCYGAGNDPVLDHVKTINFRDKLTISASPNHVLDMTLPWKISQDDGSCPLISSISEYGRNVLYYYDVPTEVEPVIVSGMYSISNTLYCVCTDFGGVSFRGVSGISLFNKEPEPARFVKQVSVTTYNGKTHIFSLGPMSPLYSSKKTFSEEDTNIHNDPELQMLYTGDCILPPHGLTIICNNNYSNFKLT
jgi:hypothetical protein